MLSIKRSLFEWSSSGATTFPSTHRMIVMMDACPVIKNECGLRGQCSSETDLRFVPYPLLVPI